MIIKESVCKNKIHDPNLITLNHIHRIKLYCKMIEEWSILLNYILKERMKKMHRK